jgi:tripartite-type tricarboxylate transporter receptor subunit TctC
MHAMLEETMNNATPRPGRRQRARLHVLAMAATAALTFACGAALAQPGSYPTRPIRIVVPFPPGGGVDFVARTVAQRLGDSLKQQVLVENRSGAGGRIGAEAVARSAPDGYTLLMASPAEVVVLAALGQKLNYDPRRDLLPVTLAGEAPLVIAVHPSLAAKSIPDLIALARSRPGKVGFATPGAGSSMQFAGAMLEILGKVDLTHIPYKGAAPALSDALGGQVPVLIVGIPPVVQHAKAGKLRVLAVTGERRSSALSDVPAVAELPGFAGYRFTNWMGVFVAAKTPAPIVERLNMEIARIVREPATREVLAAQGVEVAGFSIAEFEAFLDSEARRYATIARERMIAVEE